MALIIRPEEINDLPGIHAVHSAAYNRETEADLVDRLRNEGLLNISLLAEISGLIVGHIAFSPVTFDRNPNIVVALALGPIAVHPDFQDQGLSKKLIEAGLQRAKALDYGAVVALGPQDYYTQTGFVPAQTYEIENDFGVSPDEFQIIELSEGALKAVSGFARYSDAFYTL